MTENFKAVPCPCGNPHCRSWLVEPVADVRGVNFTQEQAEAVVKLLNKMEEERAA